MTKGLNSQHRLLCVASAGGFHRHAAPPPTPLPELLLRLCGTAACAQLTPTDPECFRFVCSSTCEPRTHASFCRTATLVNTSGVEQTFELQVVEGAPWELVSAVPSVPQDREAFRYSCVRVLCAGWAPSCVLAAVCVAVTCCTLQPPRG
jgi:hypothetical protein